MNPNEIKKNLRYCIDSNDCIRCDFTPSKSKKRTVGCQYELTEKALAYINQLEAEVERFKKRQKPTETSGYKIENGKVVFFTNILNGYRYEYKDLEEVVKTLNELLKEAYSKDEIAFALKCKTEDLKTTKSEAIKEFAEQLYAEIESSDKYIREYDDSEVQKAYNKGLRDALKVLKEMVGDEE